MLDFVRWLYTAVTCTQCMVDSIDFVDNVAQGNVVGAMDAANHLVADMKHMTDGLDS